MEGMDSLPAGMEGLAPGMMNLEDLGAADGEFDSPHSGGDYEVGVKQEVPSVRAAPRWAGSLAGSS